jgi:hypothetical protein
MRPRRSEPSRRYHAHAGARADSLNGLPLATFWQRLLGYFVDLLLELGLGFLQFFWDPNRMCAQDRLAETIVIDVRKERSQGA